MPVRGEVGLEGVDGEFGEIVGDEFAALLQGCFGEVDGDIAGRILDKIEEKAGFFAAAGAQIDEMGLGAKDGADEVALGSCEGQFGARQIIFVELGDLIKEFAARFVIEIF